MLESLIALVKERDCLVRESYLSNKLNFDIEMPAFFLSYKENQLVGLLTVCVDDKEREIVL